MHNAHENTILILSRGTNFVAKSSGSNGTKYSKIGSNVLPPKNLNHSHIQSCTSCEDTSYGIQTAKMTQLLVQTIIDCSSKELESTKYKLPCQYLNSASPLFEIASPEKQGELNS